jgi:hypothetical protein
MNMKCDKYQDLIMRHFDHLLNKEESELLSRHADSCPGCRALMSDMSSIMQALETAPVVEPPADMEKMVMNRIDSLPENREHESNNIIKAIYGTLSVVAVMLACVVTLGVYDGVLSLMFQGAGSLNSFIENAWNLQVVYNLVTDAFSQILFSIFNTIQAVYILAGFTAVILGFIKLIQPGSFFHKAKE